MFCFWEICPSFYKIELFGNPHLPVLPLIHFNNPHLNHNYAIDVWLDKPLSTVDYCIRDFVNENFICLWNRSFKNSYLYMIPSADTLYRSDFFLGLGWMLSKLYGMSYHQSGQKHILYGLNYFFVHLIKNSFN